MWTPKRQLSESDRQRYYGRVDPRPLPIPTLYRKSFDWPLYLFITLPILIIALWSIS